MSTSRPLADHKNKQNHCRTREECECKELSLRRGSPLACGVMCFVNSSFIGYLPARANEQGNVIGLVSVYIVCTKKIVI